MTEKRVSVRLVAEGGRQVRAELEGIGDAGARGFGRLSSEMEMANTRMAAFARRARAAAVGATVALAAAGAAMIRSGLQTVDAQAKLAQSLGTTVASIQTLERAGELAGVSMSGIEQATKDLTRRLSQAAAGSGPAADALERLGLSASDLIALPLDQRVGAINAAIEKFVPAAERAAVAGQLFGEEGSIAMSRIDTLSLRQATADVLAFGVVVSEQDADRFGKSLNQAGNAATNAGGAAADAAEIAKTGWEAAVASLADYAARARDIGGDIGNALVGAFTSAENAIGEFVKTGKLDFRSLVTSLLADMAKLSTRKFILGPLANALSGALGNLGSIFAPVLHAGGMAETEHLAVFATKTPAPGERGCATVEMALQGWRKGFHRRISRRGMEVIEPSRSMSWVTSSRSVSNRTGTSNSKPAVILVPLAGAVIKVTRPVVVSADQPEA